MIPTGTVDMARVKAVLSEAPCWYCDTLYGKRREDAGYSTCEVCEQATNKGVRGNHDEEQETSIPPPSY